MMLRSEDGTLRRFGGVHHLCRLTKLLFPAAGDVTTDFSKLPFLTAGLYSAAR